MTRWELAFRNKNSAENDFPPTSAEFEDPRDQWLHGASWFTETFGRSRGTFTRGHIAILSDLHLGVTDL